MRFSNSAAQRALLPVGIFALSANAFWRMPCQARSGLARIDPLVSYDTIAEHVHAIHGGNGFSTTAKTDQLLASTCTSCAVTQDNSAYWHPALYFKDSSTGKFTLVEELGGMLAYYLLQPNSNEKTVTAFPKDFEMISGDTNQRNFSYPVPDIEKSLWNKAPYNTQAFLRQAALGFNCLDYSKTPEGSLYRHSLPDKAYLDANCKNGVRFELMFPSCWNGKDVTSKNKKDHVAFPSQVMTGDCPTGFPTRLPSLFYETIWNTYAFAGKSGEFVLANGDTTGNGYHGDFINGWDTKFLQSAADTCTSLSGKVEDCSLFTIQDSSKYSNCNITLPSAIATEQVISGMTSLPGNVPIARGPAYASGAAPGQTGATTASSVAPDTTTAPVSIPTYAPGTKISSGSQFVPGGIFAAKATPSVSAAAEISSVPSAVIIPVASSQTTAAPKLSEASKQVFYSTQYETKGNVVNEILWVQEEVTVTASATSTLVVPAVGSRKRHLHHHQRRGY